MLRAVVYFLFLITFVGYSQTLSKWHQKLITASEAQKVEIYLKLGNELANKFGYADSLLIYSNKAYQIAYKNNLKAEQSRARLGVAVAYQRMNLYDTSNVILENLKSEADKGLLGDIYFTVGLNEYRVNKNREAIENYLIAAAAYSKDNNNDGLAMTYCRMAAIFNNEKQVTEAISYANKTKSLIDKIRDPFVKLTTLSGLSGIYVQSGIEDKRYLDSAINYATKAIEIVVKNEYYSKANQLFNSVSNAYYLQHDSIKALDYAIQSLKFRKFLLPSEILISYMNLSDCYNRVQKHESALDYLDSLAIVIPTVNDPYYRMGLYERVYAYNKDAGNLKNALLGLERFKALQDSLYNLDKNTALNELEQKYNKSENEKRIYELNKQNEIASLNVKILVIGILAVILTLVVIVFFYRQSVLKSKFKALETEQRLNRARMDPHFFFNALSSIQTLSMDEENNKKVPSLISKFSKIIRQSLESTYDELITVEEEVSFLTNYLDLQKLRYNDKFEYEIKVDDNVEQDELKVLGMLLQPFIENSIEHGFKNIDYKGLLTISFIKAGNSLKVELRDNGVGFNTDTQHKEYPSRATQIISDRLMLLNKRKKSNAGYKLSKNPDGKGVLVEVVLPIIT